MANVVMGGPKSRENLMYAIDADGCLNKVVLYINEMFFRPAECIHKISKLERLGKRYDEKKLYAPKYQQCSTDCVFFQDPVEFLGELGEHMVKLKLCSGELIYPRGAIADLRPLRWLIENRLGSFWFNNENTFQRCNVYINETIAPYGEKYKYNPDEYAEYGGAKRFWEEVERQEYSAQ